MTVFKFNINLHKTFPENAGCLSFYKKPFEFKFYFYPTHVWSKNKHFLFIVWWMRCSKTISTLSRFMFYVDSRSLLKWNSKMKFSLKCWILVRRNLLHQSRFGAQDEWIRIKSLRDFLCAPAVGFLLPLCAVVLVYLSSPAINYKRRYFFR